MNGLSESIAVDESSDDNAEWLYSVDGPQAGRDSEDVSIPIPWQDGANEEVDETSLKPILTYDNLHAGAINTIGACPWYH